MPLFYRNAGNASYSLRGSDRPGCLLFAEGDSEALFLDKWLSGTHRDPNDIAVVCIRGIKKLDAVLKNLRTDENFPAVSRFGFFVDAETIGPTRKSTFITNVLAKNSVIPAGHKVPAGPLVRINGKRIVLFVSPNNASAGFIEHTVMNEINTSELFPCIGTFQRCVAGTSASPVSPKALVQAYIGTLKPGLCGTGRGFESGVLNVMHTAYDNVRATIERVL